MTFHSTGEPTSFPSAEELRMVRAIALIALLERSSHTLGVLLEELAKLALALGASDEQRVKVTAKEIDEVCARTRLVDPFEFADAVGERNLKRALETLGGIFAHGLGDYKRPGRVVTNESEIAMRLLAAVTYKLTQLQDIRAAIDARIPEFEAFKAAKLFGFRQEGARRALRKHTAASLREAMEALRSLGYSREESREALQKIPKEIQGTEKIIKEALKNVGKK